ncbi:three-Cys-motif partner protein TcmP [Sorangium sp. So ce1335]|uniref:three-Cys-motif partner protein TcmP n=1 Tax=Sorangium sp. So ce1335 TaxID=3133335 RepID=UPI003F5E3892
MAKYDWSDGPATLGAHSLAKHTILREYIERYIPILTKGGTVPLKLMLIDGFAGGGQYVVEGQGNTLHPGSPLILINAVRSICEQARRNGQKKCLESC